MSVPLAAIITHTTQNVSAILQIAVQRHCRNMELKIFICNSVDVATTIKEKFKTYFN